MKKSIIAIVFVIIFIFFFSCSDDKELDPTQFIVVNKTDESIYDYILVYYDQEGKCLQIKNRRNDGIQLYDGKQIENNDSIKIDKYTLLPDDSPISEIHIIYTFVEYTGFLDGYFRSFRLDTVFHIIKNQINTFELPSGIKNIEVDRQNPYEYPEELKDAEPSWT